jgi:hypothetical protein
VLKESSAKNAVLKHRSAKQPAFKMLDFWSSCCTKKDPRGDLKTTECGQSNFSGNILFQVRAQKICFVVTKNIFSAA